MRELLKISPFLLIFLVSCASAPQDISPQPDIDRSKAERSFNELNDEVGISQIEVELSGVANESSGTMSNNSSFSEPDASEIIEYKTGEPGWVEVEETRIYSNSVSPDKAKQELIQILRNVAVSKKVPPTVEVTSLLTDIMSETGNVASEQTAWSGFFRSTVSGIITAEEILFDDLKPINGRNSYEKTIKLKAYVEPVRGQRDPGFYINVDIENNLLKSGEELAFKVTPSKDCYIYIFNFMADQNAFLMYPNEFMKENFIKAKTTLEIPDPAIRQHVSFVVSTLPGENISAESAYIICTKEPVKLIEDLPMIGTSMPVLSNNSKSFMKLQRWLTRIPLNQRVEKNLIYHISN